MVGTTVAQVPALHASRDPQSDDTREGNRTDHCREIHHASVHVPRFDFHLQESTTSGCSLHVTPMARRRVSTASKTHPCQRSQLLHKRLPRSLVQVWALSNNTSSSTFTMSDMWLTWASATGAVDSLSSSHRASIVELGLNMMLSGATSKSEPLSKQA